MAIEPGSLLNQRYRILETLSRGGMGAVYRAHDEILGVEVAVKENLFTEEGASRQFRREATILASLRHPNLPLVTDHFVLAGQGQYLVMDFIGGEDLRQRLARTGPLAEAEAVRIGAATCDALDYLHRRQPPILHRDVKPGNIRLTPTGQVYLVDFGLAREVQAGQATTTGAQGLTPGFAPPEQYGQGTDARSDIYSLAATLYNALTGSLPEDAMMRALKSAGLTSLRERRPGINPRLAAVIEKGLAVAPSERFQSAAEFKSALLSSLPEKPPVSETIPAIPESSAAVPAVPPRPPAGSAARAPAKAGKGRALLIIGGSFLVIAILAGGLLALRGLRSAAQARRQASAPTMTLTAAIPTNTAAPVVVAATTQTVSPSPQPSPTAQPVLAATTQAPAPTQPGSGSGKIAFASDRDGTPQIWQVDAGGGTPQQLTHLQSGACQPDWSPDGKRLVFISPCPGRQEQYRGAGLLIADADGSHLTPLATAPGGDYDPAWSPDGNRIAFTSLRDGRPHIYLYDLKTDQVTLLSPQPSSDQQPAWSPDGKQIAFATTRLGKSQIWIMSADGADPREFSLIEGDPASHPAWFPDGSGIIFNQGATQPWLITQQIGDRFSEAPFAEDLRPAVKASFSPDGGWLAFEGLTGGTREICRITLQGTDLTCLTSGLGNSFQPAWSPE